MALNTTGILTLPSGAGDSAQHPCNTTWEGCCSAVLSRIDVGRILVTRKIRAGGALPPVGLPFDRSPKRENVAPAFFPSARSVAERSGRTAPPEASGAGGRAPSYPDLPDRPRVHRITAPPVHDPARNWFRGMSVEHEASRQGGDRSPTRGRASRLRARSTFRATPNR